MATSLDFSRAVNLNITAYAGRRFDAVLTFTRDDAASVDWSSKTLIFKLYDRFNSVALMEWTNSQGFSVSTNVITFNQVFETLGGSDFEAGTYDYEFYNETDLQAIAYGKVILK